MYVLAEVFVALAAGLVVGYIVSALIESIFHQKVSDAPRRAVLYWQRHPRLFAVLLRANYSHHIIHHRKTFRTNYITQFGSEAEQKALDEELAARGTHGLIIRESQYAMTLHGTGILSFVAPFVPLAVLSVIFGGWAFGCGFIFASCLSPWFNTYIHSYLHMPHGQAIERSSALMRLFLKSAYFNRVVQYHYLHHKYVACNFNLLLGGDWLRDRFLGLVTSTRRHPRHKLVRNADEQDLKNMRALGLIPQKRGKSK